MKIRAIFYSKNFKEIHRTDLQFIPKENELVSLSKSKNLFGDALKEHYRVLQVRHEIDEETVSIYIDYPKEIIKPQIGGFMKVGDLLAEQFGQGGVETLQNLQ